MDATAIAQRPADTGRPEAEQWGPWMPDGSGREEVMENDARARRRAHVLRQLQEARRRRRERGPR
ncbi:hypothetical protein [Kitasatospora sp. NPDC056184]|uniref:hypothetical protein n=1 Tax=Kitasatospora sp. NPDC056184 TaxID=3345738 RepID=UPI0035DA1C85